MQLCVGTSGYSYKGYSYGRRLPPVEIDNSFYRLPEPSVLQTWAEQVPEGLRFSIEASRRITHFKAG